MNEIAPHVTLQDIEDAIIYEHYFTAADACDVTCAFEVLQRLGTLTFCVLLLKNGFMVTGQSACVSPENFDKEIGRQIARENAINKVWPLMGYALKEKLYKAE